MKTDAKQSSPGTVIDSINLSGEDEEINDDIYLELEVWLIYFDFVFMHGCILS